MADEVGVLPREDLEAAQDTPAMRRRSAFVSEGHWFGHVETEPDTMSGWHHHGDMVTLGYVLKGTVRIEYGPGGQDSVEASAGDYLLVPPHTIHREGNPTDSAGETVLVRIGEGQPMFPADGPAPA